MYLRTVFLARGRFIAMESMIRFINIHQTYLLLVQRIAVQNSGTAMKTELSDSNVLHEEEKEESLPPASPRFLSEQSGSRTNKEAVNDCYS